MKQGVVYLRLLILYLFVLSTICCKSGNQGYSPKLTEDQQQVCGFLVSVYGAPRNECHKMVLFNNTGEYLKEKYDFWENGGILSSHCSEEVKEKVSVLSNKYKWNEAFGALQSHNIWQPEYHFDNIFFILVDADWYTYFAFDGGCFCGHKVQAHVKNNLVIIDDIDLESTVRPTVSTNMGLVIDEKEMEEKRLLGAWFSESTKEIVAFGHSTRCYSIQLNEIMEPIVNEYYVASRGRFYEVANGNSRFRIDELNESSFIKDKKLLFEKILNHPVIIIKH